MLVGLQIQINALNAIIPDSFIFVMDSTDRSFIYKSSDCLNAVEEIVSLDKKIGMDNLFDTTDYYNSNTSEHFYIIRRMSSHTFLGFFASKHKFSDEKIKNAKEYFLTMQSTV